MFKRITAVLAALATVVCLCAAPAAAADAETMQQTVRALGILTGDETGSLNLQNPVTRAEFTKMMIAAAGRKDNISEQASVSLFKDVKSSHWAAGYIKEAVDQGWLAGYTDGTFRPDSQILLEEAATALLRMLGYDSQSLSGAFPSAQMNKYRALGLDENVSCAQGQVLTRRDCVPLFYNLMTAQTSTGTVYAAGQGLTLNAAGEIDYASLVAKDRKGPFIAGQSGWAASLPFVVDSLSINGVAAEQGQLAQGDVYYYNENLRSVWVYRNRATGIYTAASPSTAAPTSVTVSGVNYALASASAAYALSDMGDFRPGDTVTLLLGMNGEAVGVVKAGDLDGVRYGIVQAVCTQTYTDGYGKTWTEETATILCTDGSTYQDPSGSVSLKAGDLVRITVQDGKSVVARQSGKTLSGAVNAKATAIGDKRLADDVQILDTNDDGGALVIYPARLASASLSAGDVRFYTENADGKIDRLILDDFTGDMDTYGILTSVSEVSMNMTLMGQYRTLINGQEGMLTSSGALYGVSAGPAVIDVSGSAINSLRNLKEVSLTSVSTLSAKKDNIEYGMADNVQVYIRENGDYTLSTLSAVSGGGYNLKGYYDKTYTNGGRVRVLIATEIK